MNEKPFVIPGKRLSGCFKLRVRQEEGSLQWPREASLSKVDGGKGLFLPPIPD